ncbi:MAG TPA: vanadium-dependent haloperoxidase [Flavihumibacter sp.]|nr:vanadium-dependent haloperoxidase [Flavihumibacter sp.]HQD10384.1 vanadium-dependent haloperoxidase [Flavihumibacter sp.]
MMNRFILLLLLVSMRSQAQPKSILADQLQPAVFSLTMVMLHDVVNPPAASRFFSYCSIGAYDIVSQNNISMVPPGAFIRNYNAAKIKTAQKDYNYQIAALYSIYEAGRVFLPSGYMLDEKQQAFLAWLRKNKVKESIIDSSVSVAQQVVSHLSNWSKKDGYANLSARLRYTPLRGEQYWFPTPPSYMDAVEPHWRTIRPMIIDSSNQFIPPPLVTFSRDTSSAFYALVMEVYSVSKSLTPDQLTMAGFWDCNPFAVANAGHMSLGFKKISPGAHWMNITCIAAKKAALPFDQSVQLLAIEATTLMDAFISCWDEKYRSNRIRPETYINKYIDPRWMPVLQTPPFPEYTSGHSVVSAASAEVLTYLLGDKFAYTDNTEEMFDLKPRHFNSFREAAAEAAISRLYGGIHYRDAIDQGVVEGAKLGQFISHKLQTAGITRLTNH